MLFLKSLLLYLLIAASCLNAMRTSAQDFDWTLVDSMNVFEPNARGYDISCADDNHCVYCGFAERFQNPYRAYSFVRFTSDAGTTWRTMQLDTADLVNLHSPPTPERVSHPTPDLMIMVADSGYLYRSADAGKTWTTMRIGNYDRELYSLEMFDARTGVVVSGAPQVLRTTDSGKSWQPLLLPDSLRELSHDYAFPVGPRSVIVRIARPGDVRIARTDDDGQTWRVSTEGPWWAGRLNFPDPLHGWAVGIERDSGWFTGKDVIVRTTDGGMTWRDQVREYVDPPGGIGSVDFFDSLNGIAGGGLGKLLVTSDGGERWEKVPAFDEAIAIGGVSFPSLNRAYALGRDASVVRLTRKSSSVTGELVKGGEADVRLVERLLMIRMPQMSTNECTISLYNAVGQLVKRVENDAHSGQTEVPLYDLPSGVFLVAVESGGEIVARSRIVLIE